MQKTPQRYIIDFSEGTLGRRNNFDLLRILAALLVVFSHSFIIAENSLEHDPLSLLTQGQTNLGRAGLFIFFVISGFLITASYTKSSNLGTFLKNRFLRIFPGFLCATVLTAFVLGPFLSSNPDHYFIQWGPYQYLLNLTLCKWVDTLPGVFLHNPSHGYVNGSLWSIRFEVCCYLAVCLLGAWRILSGPSTLWLFLATGLLNIILSFPPFPALTTHGVAFVLTTFLNLYAYFLAGSIFYHYRHQILLSVRFAVLAILWLSLAVLAPGHFPEIFWILPAAYLIFYIAYSPSIPFQNTAKYGDFSYGIYIYAWPIQQMFCQYLGAITPLILFGTSLPLILLIAFLSWHAVEKKALQLKKVEFSTALKRLTDLRASHKTATASQTPD